MINISDASVKLNEFSLSIPSLDLNKPVIHLSGPNGAGKSTLLKVALGLIPLSIGNGTRNPDEHYGYVPQHYRSSMLPWLSAKRNLLLHKDDEKLIEKLLATGFNRADLSKRPTHLSGGQCQRICVVREATAGFDCIVLDEPFSGIDYKTVPVLGELLASEIKNGLRVILTSHTALPTELTSIDGFQEVEIERVSDTQALVVDRTP